MQLSFYLTVSLWFFFSLTLVALQLDTYHWVSFVCLCTSEVSDNIESGVLHGASSIPDHRSCRHHQNETQTLVLLSVMTILSSLSMARKTTDKSLLEQYEAPLPFKKALVHIDM